MKITELVKICSSNQKEVLKNIDFILAYILFQVLLDKEAEIPEIGQAFLQNEKGEKILKIRLTQKWQDLLSKSDISDILVEQLSGYIQELK